MRQKKFSEEIRKLQRNESKTQENISLLMNFCQTEFKKLNGKIIKAENHTTVGWSFRLLIIFNTLASTGTLALALIQILLH